MVAVLKHLLILMPLLGASLSFADTCEVRLSPEKTKEKFLVQAAQGFSSNIFTKTSLEISAYLRRWKAELAARLEIDAHYIKGDFRRGSASFVEANSSGEVRLLIVRTGRGLKTLVINEINLKGQRLRYLDPTYTVRVRESSIYPHPDRGRPSFRVSAAEDLMDRQSEAGNVVGVLTMQVPGLNLLQ